MERAVTDTCSEIGSNKISDVIVEENNHVIYNREYKSSVFADLFSRKENLLELYKVLHKNDAELDSISLDDIEEVRLKPIVVNNIQNDVAFRVRDRLIILVEHQSTINVNMPARMFFYLADELRKHTLLDEDAGRILHKQTLVPLPAPEFYVVYTGEKEYTDELLLSSAFGSDEFMELKVKIIKDADVDNPLGGYLKFIKTAEAIIKERMRINHSKRKEEAEHAIREAIRFCIDKGILVEYLKEREKEVITMYTTELTFEDIENLRREEGREEGIILGEIKIILNMRKRGDSISEIAECAEVDESKVRQILEENDML